MLVPDSKEINIRGPVVANKESAGDFVQERYGHVPLSVSTSNGGLVHAKPANIVLVLDPKSGKDLFEILV